MKWQLKKRFVTFALSLLAGFLSVPMLLAQPTITELNGTDFPLSGRVAITGTGLGTDGQVFIDGIQAWTATWTSERVVAYVPEQASLGSTTVQLITGGQPSNSVTLNVHARQSDGRVKWTFETDGDVQYYRPAQAPDGTLYMHTHNETQGLTYALTPSGGLKWIRKVNWTAYVPPSAGPDGALYVGSINTLYRISPQGQIDWTFNSLTISAGPKVGPDALLYGAFEVSLGAYAIDPQTGDLVWSNDEANMSAYGTAGNEITFGWSEPGGPIDRFYVYWDAMYAFSLDGDHLFTTGTANTLNHEPAIGLDGTMYTPGYLEYYLVAFSPSNGQILWQTDSDWNSHISDMEIDSSDTLYFISDGRYMHAYDPHSQSTVWRTQANTWLSRPTLSPDESILITAGGGYQDVIPFVKAFSTSTGEELWNLNLQEDFTPEFRHVPEDRARISHDSATAYISSFSAQWPFHDGDPRATLFAIQLKDSMEIVAHGMSVVHGLQVGGTITDLTESDDQYLILDPEFLNSRYQLEFTVDAASPSSAPTAFEFNYESRAFNFVGTVDQKIELFNYVSGQFETVDTRLSSSTDTVVNVTPGGDPARFVQAGTNAMQARIRYQNSLPFWVFSTQNLYLPYRVRADHIFWTITP